MQRLGKTVLLTGSVTQRLSRIPHRRARPVADHVGHLGGVTSTVTVIDVLDGLLTAVGFDIKINVGWTVPLR